MIIPLPLMSGKLGITEYTVSIEIHVHSWAINVTVHDEIPDKRGISSFKKLPGRLGSSTGHMST
jgi:hypothetical protein